MIDSEYIKKFLPIQELDELKVVPGETTVRLSADDLFLMSKLSAYATTSSDAIAVSKKLTYKNLADKLSDDFDLYGMSCSVSSDISALSAAIVLSTLTLSTMIDETSSFLSDSIYLSVNVLSNEIESLSNTVSSDYIKKYGI